MVHPEVSVLGLGHIGALAGKPVMEGKGVLFKRFADIDVFDIEIDEHDTEKLIQIIKSLEPTFGGINLEDFKAPECFELEARCVGAPVFDPLGNVEAAVGLSGTILQMDDANLPRIIELVKDAARKIARQLARPTISASA